MRKNILIVLALAIIALGAWYFSAHPAPQTQPPTNQNAAASSTALIADVHYMCNGGKTIDAKLYKGGTTPPAAPGEPPTPGGSAVVSLSDGRTFDLHQTISADGARYSNGDPMKQGSETFVFWSKGNGALVLENNEQKNYAGCIEVKPDPGNLPQVYENGAQGFSVRYPAGFTADPTYQYQELGPGKTIDGVSFTIPSSTASGTNLGVDTNLSVEEIPQTKECTASIFLPAGYNGPVPAATTTIDGTDYSVASSTGAGAGNRYEEIVYALPYTNPCIAVRYFIHYSVIENYPPGMVQAFDEKALIGQFDAIRNSLTVNQ